MNTGSNNPTQLSLFLRILGGGYLVYLAWGLRGAIQDSPLFQVAVIVFAAVGLLLVGHSGWKLLRKEYTKDGSTQMIEESEEPDHE